MLASPHAPWRYPASTIRPWFLSAPVEPPPSVCYAVVGISPMFGSIFGDLHPSRHPYLSHRFRQGPYFRCRRSQPRHGGIFSPTSSPCKRWDNRKKLVGDKLVTVAYQKEESRRYLSRRRTKRNGRVMIINTGRATSFNPRRVFYGRASTA